jgi:hypothetical protein
LMGARRCGNLRCGDVFSPIFDHISTPFRPACIKFHI